MPVKEHVIESFKSLIGKTIVEVRFNREYLIFKTDAGEYQSYQSVKSEMAQGWRRCFYEVYGVDNLLGQKITNVSWNEGQDSTGYPDYGYSFSTEDTEFAFSFDYGSGVEIDTPSQQIIDSVPIVVKHSDVSGFTRD